MDSVAVFAVSPTVSVIAGALLAVFGGFGARYLLDRRQEQTRARAFARVIRDELVTNAQVLEHVLDAHQLWVMGGVSDQAWVAHRSDVAAELLEEEYLALATTYRALGGATSAVTGFLERHGTSDVPTPEQIADSNELDIELRQALLIVRQIGLPSISWLASADPTWFRWRRPKRVLSPIPVQFCGCGHPFDHHRWSLTRRHVRLKWRRYNYVRKAHECNVTDCRCRYFRRQGASRLERALISLRLRHQGTFVEELEQPQQPERDPGTPESAQPDGANSWDPEAYSELSGRWWEAVQAQRESQGGS